MSSVVYIDGIAIEVIPPDQQLSHARTALAEYQQKLGTRRAMREESERVGRSAEAILLLLDEMHRLDRLSAIEVARIEYLTHQISQETTP